MDDDALPDPALAEVWPDMTTAEKLFFHLALGEQPPPELRERVRDLYDERPQRGS